MHRSHRVQELPAVEQSVRKRSFWRLCPAGERHLAELFQRRPADNPPSAQDVKICQHDLQFITNRQPSRFKGRNGEWRLPSKR